MEASNEQQQPAGPVAPDPVAPDAPYAPQGPDQPAPDQPATPGAPGAPGAPSEPVSPDQPAPAPDQPAAPAAPESAGATAPESGGPDLEAEVAQLRRQLDVLEGKASSGQLQLGAPDKELLERVSQTRKNYEDWPQEGDDRSQPWDLRAHGLPQPGVTRDYLPPGTPDELSPVVIGHNHPILQAGSAGGPVAELAALLESAGYPTSISKGTNHSYTFDDSVSAALAAFTRDYGVKEDPSQFPPQHDPNTYVGPWIWEALHRVFSRKQKAAA